MRGFRTLEKRYGIEVVSEGYELFRIYTADGDAWAKGLSRKGVKACCEYWHDALLKIKKTNKADGLL